MLLFYLFKIEIVSIWFSLIYDTAGLTIVLNVTIARHPATWRTTNCSERLSIHTCLEGVFLLCLGLPGDI